MKKYCLILLVISISCKKEVKLKINTKLPKLAVVLNLSWRDKQTALIAYPQPIGESTSETYGPLNTIRVALYSPKNGYIKGIHKYNDAHSNFVDFANFKCYPGEKCKLVIKPLGIADSFVVEQTIPNYTSDPMIWLDTTVPNQNKIKIDYGSVPADCNFFYGDHNGIDAYNWIPTNPDYLAQIHKSNTVAGTASTVSLVKYDIWLGSTAIMTNPLFFYGDSAYLRVTYFDKRTYDVLKTFYTYKNLNLWDLNLQAASHFSQPEIFGYFTATPSKFSKKMKFTGSEKPAILLRFFKNGVPLDISKMIYRVNASYQYFNYSWGASYAQNIWGRTITGNEHLITEGQLVYGYSRGYQPQIDFLYKTPHNIKFTGDIIDSAGYGIKFETQSVQFNKGFTIIDVNL